MTSISEIDDIIANGGLTELDFNLVTTVEGIDEEFGSFPFQEFLGVVPQVSAAAGALFDFGVSVVNASADAAFDAFIDDVAAVTAAALDLWATFIDGADGSNIEVAVTIADLAPGTVASATAGSFFVGAEDDTGFVEVFTSAQLELITGTDFNGATPDVVITVNSGFLAGASFDTDPDRIAIPGVIDFVSVLAHEINHSLGFLSFRDNTGEDFLLDIDGDGDLETLDSTYGTFVDFEDNGDPFLTATFSGDNLLDVYGEAVILETTTGSGGSDVSHFAAFSPTGDGSFTDTALALENPFVIAGDIVDIGAIELAVLADLGFNVTIPDDLPLINDFDPLAAATPVVSLNPELSVVDGQVILTVERTAPFLTVPTSVGVEITGPDGTTQTLRARFDLTATDTTVAFDPATFFETIVGDQGTSIAGDVSVRLFFPAQGVLASGAQEETTTLSADFVVGTDLPDYLNGGDTSETFLGGAGDDTINGEGGDDLIFGDSGDDIISGGSGNDTLNGGAGNDTFTSGGGGNSTDQDVIALGVVGDGSSGSDIVTDFDTNNFDIEATSSEGNFDTLTFTFGDVDFSLSEGSDIIDFVEFIESDDNTETDAFRDGRDLVLDFGNGDHIRLEDVIGDDGVTVRALNAVSVDRFRESELSVNLIEGTPEDDILAGGDNGETILGDAGNDLLSGAGGDDIIEGGSGNDTLEGGSGNDVLTSGGGGTDQDVIALGTVGVGFSGSDVVTDFDTNNFDIEATSSEGNFDTLTFTFGGVDFSLSEGSDFVDFVDFIESDDNTETDAFRDGRDLVLDFGNGDHIRLEDIIGDDGITNAALNAASVDSFNENELSVFPTVHFDLI